MIVVVYDLCAANNDDKIVTGWAVCSGSGD
jgi:hypothetical protein